MKISDFSFKYVMRSKSIQPRCDLRIYEIGRGQPSASTKIVVFSEPTDGYQGVSVTNAAEIIASEVKAMMFGDTDIGHILWIEHYPKGSLGHVRGLPDESFDLVTFSWRGNTANCPVWHRISREWVETLVGEAI